MEPLLDLDRISQSGICGDQGIDHETNLMSAQVVRGISHKRDSGLMGHEQKRCPRIYMECV